MNVVVGDGIWW